jgi:branched-chain amino acid aminotransferase
MPFPEEKGKIWANGKLINWRDAKIHVMSHVIHYGSGVFEGIRCYDTVKGSGIFRLNEHIQRLFKSASIYKLKIQFTQEEIKDAIIRTVQANQMKACYIRPVVFYGYNTLGVFPGNCPTEVYIGVYEWGAYLGEEELTKGAKVMFTSWTKFHSSMMPTLAKASGQYLNSMLAVMDARDKGFNEAILLDRIGNISEGSGENIFFVKNKTIYTNDADSSILMGITRDSVITIAKDLGYEVMVKTISKGELLSADEVFFTGTAAEVTPIREIDGRIIGSGSRGPITEKIQSTFFDVVKGKSEKYMHWLTMID